MLISHRHRFIYIKSRKTAGTSLEFALSSYLGPGAVITPFGEEEESRRIQAGGGPAQNFEIPYSRWRVRDWVKALGGKPPRFSQHSPAYVVRRYVPGDMWDGYFKFSFERNPWDLAVSAYYWYHRKDLDRPSFTDFVFSDNLAKYSNWAMYAIDNEVVVDRVYRFDQMDQALRDLARRFELEGELKVPRAKGEHRTDRRPYWHVYGERERRRVADVFAREIAEFGWVFGE
jgi:hypothetical protein